MILRFISQYDVLFLFLFFLYDFPVYMFNRMKNLNSLREHPHFRQIVADRLRHGDVQSLAKVLSALSIGRQL